MRPQQSCTGWASSLPRCDVMVEPCPEAGICHRSDGSFEVEMSARSGGARPDPVRPERSWWSRALCEGGLDGEKASK